MPPASNEEQFKFLISCIRYSNGGKVDFGEVAKECNIVTKGAAAKRYERMMKSHGIAPNAASARAGQVSRIFKTERKASIAAVKKRKVDDSTYEFGARVDDDEVFDNIKAEAGVQEEQLQVKFEPDHAFDNTENTSSLHPMPSLSGECSGQTCLDTASMYDQNTDGFNTLNSRKAIYDLANDAGFLAFNEFENTNDNHTDLNSRQASGKKVDSIIIAD